MNLTLGFRRSLYALFIIVLVGAMWALLQMTSRDIPLKDVPLPFGSVDSSSSPLGASLVDIGMKGNKRITVVQFDNQEVSEPIAKDALSIVLTPHAGSTNASGFSVGAPMNLVLHHNKKLIGYRYSSFDAALERAAAVLADSGKPMTFSELFPGEFFASFQELQSGTTAGHFSTLHGITFHPLQDISLDLDARYVLMALDDGILFRARALQWCGDGVLTGTEACDDRNNANNDGCDGICRIENGYTCSGAPSVCIPIPFICGDGIKHPSEGCEDGNLFDRDLCSSTCAVQTLWSRDIGPISAADARGDSGACTVLFDRGMTGWRLPTMAQLQANRPALLRFGMHGEFWTSDGNTPGDQTNLKTLNIDTGVESVANADASQLSASCVMPTTSVTRFCFDNDHSTTPITDDNVSIYEANIAGEWSGADLLKVESDRCIDSNTLEEVMCNSDQVIMKQTVTCPCSNGACVQ